MSWLFEDYVLDLSRRELRCGSMLVKLEPQALDLLAYLIAHRHRVVPKDELIREIWHRKVVSDAALTTRVRAVRRAIGDDGKTQRLIRTFPRRGVRFVGEIRDTGSVGEPAATAAFESPTRKPVWPAAPRPRLVVLPFSGIGVGSEQHWFAQSLTDEIVGGLMRFRWFSVIAPEWHAGAGTLILELKQTAQELAARYVVRGTVHRRGDRMWVSSHLVETIRGSLLWADRFDSSALDIFDLQERVVEGLVGGIEAALYTAEVDRFHRQSEGAVSPYELRMRANPIGSDRKEGMLRSLALLEQAIALDPRYGLALGDAARCRQIMDFNGLASDRQENRREAIELARRATQCSDDSEAISTAAHVLAYFGEDIDLARELMDHALALNRSSSRGWFAAGMVQLYAGQPECALECFETSLRLNARDPVGQRNVAGIGIAQLFRGNLDAAVSNLRIAAQQFPRWATPNAALATCHIRLGSLRDAKAVIGRLKHVDPLLKPSAAQFRNPKHRELLAPGIKLATSKGYSS